MGKRGPAPKPTKLKELAGNPGKRKLNKNEPKPSVREVLPPDWLSEEAKNEWERLYKELKACGLITINDRAAMTSYCQAWGHFVSAEKEFKKSGGYAVAGAKGGMVLNPLFRAMMIANEAMLRAAKEFGMTPSSRSGLNFDRNKDDNPFADLEN